jgi:SAM-dependent methyltransferase
MNSPRKEKPVSSHEDKQRMRSFYDQEAADRNDEQWLRAGGTPRVPESRASHYFLDRKVEMALKLTNAPRAGRVLEVGCSFGHQTFLLANHFAQVMAVDLSPESINLARRRAAAWNVTNVAFEVGDAEALSTLVDASFDAVFSFSTVRFCPRPDVAMREMYRVLRPGGGAAIDFPNANCPWYGPIKKAVGVETHVHDVLFHDDEVRALFAQAGFTNFDMRPILFTSKRVPDPLLPAFRVLDAVGERTPGLRGYAGVLMARGTRHAER